jgi:MFS family permease
VVTALGTAQTLAWASTYYVPAILADPIAVDLGLSRQWIFGAYSLALLITAALGPAVGRFIDRHGGRGVLSLSNLVIAAGLAALAAASGPVTLCLAWAILGVAMALGLYDAAFATLTAIYRHEARGAITGITLFAGFASTVSWPVSAVLNEAVGWQGACLVWAGLNLIVGLPLNRFLLPDARAADRPAEAAAAKIGWTPRREMVLLAFVFAAGWFVAGAMGAHLPGLLQRAGATPVEAIAAAALVGPASQSSRCCAASIPWSRRGSRCCCIRLVPGCSPSSGRRRWPCLPCCMAPVMAC